MYFIKSKYNTLKKKITFLSVTSVSKYKTGDFIDKKYIYFKAFANFISNIKTQEMSQRHQKEYPSKQAGSSELLD